MAFADQPFQLVAKGVELRQLRLHLAEVRAGDAIHVGAGAAGTTAGEREQLAYLVETEAQVARAG